MTRPVGWPWSPEQTWSIRGEALTEETVYDTWLAIPRGRHAICAALGTRDLSHRRADRTMQLLRRSGWARYSRSAGWEWTTYARDMAEASAILSRAEG